MIKTGQWQGQNTGRTDKGLRWAGWKKAGCQLILVSPRLGRPDKSGTAQSEAVLFGYFGL